jgi:hypothetical protein
MSKKTPKEVSRELTSSREAKSRSDIKMLSRGQIDGCTVQTVYKEGYTTLTVKSVFNGKEDLAELFYEILQKRLTTYDENMVQYKSSQSAYVVPQESNGGTTQC